MPSTQPDGVPRDASAGPTGEGWGGGVASRSSRAIPRLQAAKGKDFVCPGPRGCFRRDVTRGRKGGWLANPGQLTGIILRMDAECSRQQGEVLGVTTKVVAVARIELSEAVTGVVILDNPVAGDKI